MNNRYIFLFLLLANAGLQSMEPKVEELPDWKEKENILVDFCKTFLEETFNSLPAEFKKGDDAMISVKNLSADCSKELGISTSKFCEVLKTIRLKNGNTFTHLLVMYEKNKTLVECVQHNAISFEKNEQGETAFDIAFTKFFSLMKEAFKTNKKVADMDVKASRCSYLILSNYIQLKQNPDHIQAMRDENGDCIWCCQLHSK